MSLADKVIEANKKPKYEIDEYGIRLELNNPEYVAARIVFRNILNRKENPETPLLHNRRNMSEMWLGNRQLEMDKKTIYELADIKRTIKDYEVQTIWESVLVHTLSLDESKIIVDDYTYWDIERGELCHTKERMVAI